MTGKRSEKRATYLAIVLGVIFLILQKGNARFIFFARKRNRINHFILWNGRMEKPGNVGEKETAGMMIKWQVLLIMWKENWRV